MRILATSREPLGVAGEALWPVPPLDVPPAGAAPIAAPDYPAVRLFADRAKAARPGFALLGEEDGNKAAAAEICRRLDGMPLAIELAAARLRSLSAEQIAARLDDRFRLRTAGSRAALPRQQTLRAVVDWSWELLDKPERALLARLSVFSGGCTLEAAERVCADPGTDAEPWFAEGDVLDLLASLVDKSLLVTGETSGEVHYGMLETIRAYANERLAASSAGLPWTASLRSPACSAGGEAERRQPRQRRPMGGGHRADDPQQAPGGRGRPRRRRAGCRGGPGMLPRGR